jgi:hypothetical protein
MEIICECGHGLKHHDEVYDGCWYQYFGGTCYCHLTSETIEARYWGKWAYKQMQAAIWSTNHWMIIASKQKKEYDALIENNRVFQHRGDDLQIKLDNALEQRDAYKIRLWGQYCKKCSKDNKYDTSDAYVHASKYCPNCGKKMVWITANGEPLTYAELQEELRMCRLALRTMDSAQAELASYTKIAVDALKEIAPNNPGHFNFGIAQDALDKIKGKF